MLTPMRFVLGVDEAGRGPLAGPVAVGAVAVPEMFDVTREFPGLRDSKLLSAAKRDELFGLLEDRMARGDVRYAVEFETAEIIDRHGISHAVREALARAVNTLAPDAALVRIKLDGSLKAPPEYAQETIINGDELVPIISLASVAAKVVRDRLMVQLSRMYPDYGFEQHKGYGTSAHYAAIAMLGPCAIHRRSFLHLDSPIETK